MENLEVALITKKDASGINYCNKFGHKIMQDILNYNPGSYFLRELPFLVGLQPEKTGQVLEIEEEVIAKKVFLIHSSRTKNDEYVDFDKGAGSS